MGLPAFLDSNIVVIKHHGNKTLLYIVLLNFYFPAKCAQKKRVSSIFIYTRVLSLYTQKYHIANVHVCIEMPRIDWPMSAERVYDAGG